MSSYSEVVTIIYASLYALILLTTSIISAYEVRNGAIERKEDYSPAATDDQTVTVDTVSPPKSNTISPATSTAAKQKTDDSFFKKWLKSMWQKKKIYFALLPHIIDQASDIGVILEYHQEAQQYKISDQHRSVNPMWFFVFSVFIVIFQRIIASATIYFITYNVMSAVLQFFDILIFKAVWVNYVLHLDEPSNPQRYIQLLEAIFESSPQILLSMGYIMYSISDGQPVASIVIISTIFSLWSLTSKVISEDKPLFEMRHHEEDQKKYRKLDLKFSKKNSCFISFNGQYLVRAVCWRFLEISNRVILSVLIWINLGGLTLTIILGIEFAVLLVICVIDKTPVPLGNIMYLCFAVKNRLQFRMVQLFWAYRILSLYIYLVLVTAFAVAQDTVTVTHDFGKGLLIICWCTSFIWPYVFLWLHTRGLIPSEGDDNGGLTRDLFKYLSSGRYDEMKEILKFGAKVPDKSTNHVGDVYTETLLMRTCEQMACMFDMRDMELIQLVLKASLNQIDNTDEDGKTALRRVCECYGQLDVVKLLLDYGADVNKANPLHAAVDGRYDVVECLVSHQDININKEDDKGKTALHYAITSSKRKESLNIVKCLVDHGIDVNIKEKNQQRTAIVLAAVSKDKNDDIVDIIEYLIKNGAEIHHKDSDNKCLMDYLQENPSKFERVIAALKENK